MNRSKRPATPKSKIRLERQRLLNDDAVFVQKMLWKSQTAETFHREELVRKRLGRVIGVRGTSEANYRTEALKAELEEVAFSTMTIPSVWSAQSVEVFRDEENECDQLELVSNLANGKSCFDLLNARRESGQKTFYCEYMCPFLATKVLSRCLDALIDASTSVPSGYHGNIKPQNILLHFEPTSYMDPELAAALKTTTLDTYIHTTEEISLVCNVYLADFDAPGVKARRIKTKKQDLKESESFDDLPHFSLAKLEGEATGEERKFLLTHLRKHEEAAKQHADDIWALASSLVTICTGVFILRDDNRKRVLREKWTMEWEEQQMDEKARHAWESLPAAVRAILREMLILDWKKRPTLNKLATNPFLMDYKDECRRAREEYLELQVCCVELSYHRWQAQQQMIALEESIPKNAELDVKVGEALREAAKSNDLLTLTEILHIYHGNEKVVDNVDNSLNRTPLMLAASRGNTECVKALVQYDANLMVRTKVHDTAVVFAIEHGHMEVTRVLVEAMEDKRLVAANDRRWWTPLHFAVYHNRFKITKMLLELGIGGSPRTRDASGRTPEEYVGYKVTPCDGLAFLLAPKEQAIKDLLVAHKDNKVRRPSVRLQEEQENDHEADSDGGLFCDHEMTVLDKFHIALHSRKLKAEALLEAGLLRATVLPVNSEVTSQMRLAAEQGALPKLREYLERYGHNPNLVNHADNGHGWTAAHVAAMRGRDSCLKLLYSYGASLVLPEKRGALPLHFAVVNGHYSTTKLILELLAGAEIVVEPSSDEVFLRKEVLSVLQKGYPLKSKSGSDWTVLHHAAAHDFVDIAQLLVKCGADPKWKDADDKTCSDLVHSTKMALLFEKHINRQFESKRRSSLKSSGSGGDSGSERRASSGGGSSDEGAGGGRKLSLTPIGSSSPARGRTSSMGRDRDARSRGRSFSRDSVGSTGSLEGIGMDGEGDKAGAGAGAGAGARGLPSPPVIDNRSPSPALTRRRLDSSAYIVNPADDDLLHPNRPTPPPITQGVMESSPLTIDDAQPMLVTFAEGHTEVTIERHDMSPVLHDHDVGINSTPHGVAPVVLPPSRSPSFSRRKSAAKNDKPAIGRKPSVRNKEILKENPLPTPPPHLESAASLERRRSSALATGRSMPEPVQVDLAGLDPTAEGEGEGEEGSTLASSRDGDEGWSDNDEDDKDTYKNGRGSGVDMPGPRLSIAERKASLRINTDDGSAGSPAPIKRNSSSDARRLFGDLSVSTADDGDGVGTASPAPGNSSPQNVQGKTSSKKDRRRRDTYHSLKSLDERLTSQASISTQLKFKSSIARDLFTKTAQMLVTPAWQRNLLHAGHGEEETKSDVASNPEGQRTVVSLQSLQDITQKFVSTRARTLISALWEAADSGATDRLRTLLRQVGTGIKARHFNVVGGADVFDINDLSTIDEKCVCSPLYAAAKKGHTECARLLVEAGADPGYHDREGMTPLHVAAIWGRTAIIRLLVELGADIDVKDFKGNTALHRACFKYVKHSIATLVELGCNVTLKNKAGKRADEATKYAASRTAILNGVKKRGY